MPLRLIVAIVVLLTTMIVLFLFLLATDTALSVWHYLKQAPTWLKLGYLAVLIALPVATVVVFWSWLRPVRKTQSNPDQAAGTAEQLEKDLLASSRSGVDVSSALAEIQEQRKRKSSGEIFIAVHGEVSSGKSSLVKAILPNAEAQSDPRAGTTQGIQHYSWTAESGDRIIVADLPGFNFEDDSLALEETRRSHLVIFLCDGDLTASQARQMQLLRGLNKPVVLALNKADRYTAGEQQELANSLKSISGLSADNIVFVKAGGREEVVRMLGEGIEKRESRERLPDILPLLEAIQRHLDQNRQLMESLQNTAVLLLASEKLNLAKTSHRAQQAELLVARYAKRAIIGALAAIAPGSDLVIQGVLATQLLRELSQLYDVPVKEMEMDSFLRLAGSKIRNMTAISLAIAGNALKAFPGMGTVSGGLVHAVAYGMIFDSLGKAAAATLASRGALRPYPAAEAFEELLHENLEAGAIRFAKMAVTRKSR